MTYLQHLNAHRLRLAVTVHHVSVVTLVEEVQGHGLWVWDVLFENDPIHPLHFVEHVVPVLVPSWVQTLAGFLMV